MRRRRGTTAAVAAAAFLAGAFGLAACGGDDGQSSATSEATTTTTAETTAQPEVEKPTEVRITVVDGQPQGGIVRETVDKGDRVVLVVSSDVADEIHLHGYDLSRDVAAAGTARLVFTADLPGRFEVELEQRGTQIADLTVEQ